ncbi:SHOCT-like domain-containing protein [Tepidiforma thermophila]|uniref:SHOCT-like domain-containing protein n=1 Tax=Tepidiforma thermophila (strain KCTC 52669 / CGMCC 1.13589 / G233) TaxID=2761530 RepID=UPI003BFA75A1
MARPRRTPARAARPPRPPARAADRRREAEELRVLQLLEQGRITPQEAADLIAALRGAPGPAFADEPPAP